MEESSENAEIDVVNPDPENETANLNVNLTLSWSYTIDGNIDTTLITFDVLLFESNILTQKIVASGITDTSIFLEDLKYSTVYLWQVVAYYDGAVKKRSDVWSFSTKDFKQLPYLVVKFENGNYDVFGMDTAAIDTTQNQNLTQINLTNTIYRDWNPQYSHGGNKIAFSSNRDGLDHIYIMNNNGSDVTRVTQAFPNISTFNYGEGFCWSPDDEWILYSHYNKLYKIHKSGNWNTKIATAPAGMEFRHCDWNGYNNKIVVQVSSDTIYKSEFYIMDDDGSNMQLLVADEPGRIDNPTFSITGDRIIFTKDDDGFNDINGRQLNAHIYSLTIDSLVLTDISVGKPAGTNDLFPRYTTDGARIIFVNTSNTGNGPKTVYMMFIDGSNRTALFNQSTMPDSFE
ncbi:TolB family protein [Bacteroidota bacterium]